MPKYNTKELLLIWLDSIAELSYGEKSALYEVVKNAQSIKSVLTEKRVQLSALLKDKLNLLIDSADNAYLSRVLKQNEDFGITVITKESENYPNRLKVVEYAPLVLYCKGKTELLNTKTFAVVGSRKSLAMSIALAEKYTKTVIGCGFTPVTGIADGVDETVLKTAFKQGKGAISVFAGGVDCVYPKKNADLADKVIENGLIVTEYPLGTAAQKFRFPVRNRIIAALSDGVLIVSGGEKSGTLYTGEYAMEYGKEVFAIPYSVGVPSGKMPNEFIKRGAFLTDDPVDIYDFYGVIRQETEVRLTEEEKLIVSAIQSGAEHVEKIAEKVGKNVWEITPTLSMLEIKGVTVQNGTNKYSLIKTLPED